MKIPKTTTTDSTAIRVSTLLNFLIIDLRLLSSSFLTVLRFCRFGRCGLVKSIVAAFLLNSTHAGIWENPGALHNGETSR